MSRYLFIPIGLATLVVLSPVALGLWLAELVSSGRCQPELREAEC